MIGLSIVLANLIFFSIIGIVIISLCTLIGIIILVVGIIKKRKYKNVARSKKKKYPNVLIALGSTFIIIPILLVGTIVMDSVVHGVTSVVHSITAEKKLTPEDKCEIIIEAMKNKDKEAIKELLCENAQKELFSDMGLFNLEPDTELDNFINFIDGDIISNDEPNVGNRSFSKTAGVVDEKSNYAYIENIQTDTGNIYRIDFEDYTINKDYPEFIGIVTLRIIDKNRYTTENDFPEDAEYFINAGYNLTGLEILEFRGRKEIN